MNWATGFDMKTGRPIENPDARYTETGKPFWATPGPAGAHFWNPMAFSPKTGLVYIPLQETIFPYVPDKNFVRKSQGFNTGVDFGGDAGKPDVAKIGTAGGKGYLEAWNPVTQQRVWRVDMPGPANGGVLATAGNLVFEGTIGAEFSFAADTGAKLWSTSTQGAVMAAPIAYQVGGEQYIAVLSGFGGATGLSGPDAGPTARNISRVLVYKLGGKATLPARPVAVRPLDPPPSTASPAEIAQGNELYSRFCGVCHGAGASSTGIVPDLRYSPALKDDTFFDIVLGGALKAEGMAPWAGVLDKKEVTSIRDFVIAQAQAHKAELAKAGK
jgi:alcohol dehydrogenase (cytochrome c)/quinohemoprotein ethanol dehydrogenase